MDCIADRSEGFYRRFLRDSIGIFNIINYLGIFRHVPMVLDGFRWFSIVFLKSSGWWGGLNKFLGVKNYIKKKMSQNVIFHEK